jgi:hypothetical protein
MLFILCILKHCSEKESMAKRLRNQLQIKGWLTYILRTPAVLSLYLTPLDQSSTSAEEVISSMPGFPDLLESSH